MGWGGGKTTAPTSPIFLLHTGSWGGLSQTGCILARLLPPCLHTHTSCPQWGSPEQPLPSQRLPAPASPAAAESAASGSIHQGTPQGGPWGHRQRSPQENLASSYCRLPPGESTSLHPLSLRFPDGSSHMAICSAPARTSHGSPFTASPLAVPPVGHLQTLATPMPASLPQGPPGAWVGERSPGCLERSSLRVPQHQECPRPTAISPSHPVPALAPGRQGSLGTGSQSLPMAGTQDLPGGNCPESACAPPQ